MSDHSITDHMAHDLYGTSDSISVNVKDNSYLLKLFVDSSKDKLD